MQFARCAHFHDPRFVAAAAGEDLRGARLTRAGGATDEKTSICFCDETVRGESRAQELDRFLEGRDQRLIEFSQHHQSAELSTAAERAEPAVGSRHHRNRKLCPSPRAVTRIAQAEQISGPVDAEQGQSSYVPNQSHEDVVFGRGFSHRIGHVVLNLLIVDREERERAIAVQFRHRRVEGAIPSLAEGHQHAAITRQRSPRGRAVRIQRPVRDSALPDEAPVWIELRDERDLTAVIRIALAAADEDVALRVGQHGVNMTRDRLSPVVVLPQQLLPEDAAIGCITNERGVFMRA